MEPSYHAGETSITPHHCESHCGFFDKSVPAIRSIIKTKPHSLDCGSVDPIIAESSFAGAVSFPAPLSAAETLASSKSDLDLKESSLLRNEAPNADLVRFADELDDVACHPARGGFVVDRPNVLHLELGIIEEPFHGPGLSLGINRKVRTTGNDVAARHLQLNLAYGVL